MNSNARMKVLRFIVVGLALCIGGCKTLIPYDSEFMCEKSNDFGRCMDVQAAYNDALTAQESERQRDPQPRGKNKREWRYKESTPSDPAQPLQRLPSAKDTGAQPKAVRASLNSADLYRELEYRELAGLIEKPVTPLVRPPKVLRTLVVSYTAADSLYMPRYVFYFADEAHFVIGDYLNPAEVRPTVYPNGRRAAGN